MKTKSFIFLMLTLVSFLFSCDPPVPRPDRTPSCTAIPQVPVWADKGYVALKTYCSNADSTIINTVYVREINTEYIYISDALEGEWTLVTYQDTTAAYREYRTTFFYGKVDDPALKRMADFSTTEICTSQLDTAVKEGR